MLNKLLDQLKQEDDWTILQFSHDIDMVSRYCDRVICFNQTIVADDTPIAALSQENLLATYNPTTPKSLQHKISNFDYN